ncbi:MAG TPA: biotin carboxylase N-terminal domain-containing protein, partial [Streptosporangiaceae bacterium]
MITRVLVANRGEIARRVFRTCRDLGLSTVAVYSDADRGSPHVAEADLAVRLAGEAAADTYLRADLLVDAALRSGADAVHPGYGFLSENAAFARAVQQAGLTWVGPPPAAIESMASKIESKRLMAAAGVPVLPELSPDALTEADLPVLIKASAGGGGRGMRVVRTMADLPAGLAAARSEAAAAFGDGAVFCEPYIEAGRHLEVQILADAAGTVWTIGERECSIQRRHQKIIEEAPSPLAQRITGMRERLLDAARAAACAVGYINAGTAEFLADDSGRFYFLEMNTRLQVEHPVTECTTGLDLVALQLQVAAGQRLPATPPAVNGHAIEVRLYAEDPASGWQPQSGTLHRFEVPGVLAEFAVLPRFGPPQSGPPQLGPAHCGLRLDSGVTDGSE